MKTGIKSIKRSRQDPNITNYRFLRYSILSTTVCKYNTFFSCLKDPRPYSGQHYFSRFILTAWLSALLPTVPNIFIFETRRSEENLVECVSNFEGWDTTVKKAYFTLVFLLIFVIPLVFLEISFLYMYKYPFNYFLFVDNHDDIVFSYYYTTERKGQEPQDLNK